jgi:hypothetical protein
MGCDWHDISGSEGYGILISNKKIKEAYKPGSSSSKTRYHEPLDSNTIAWMSSKIGGTRRYRFYQIGDGFIFVSNHELKRLGLSCSMSGPYEIEEEEHKFIIDYETDLLPKVNGEQVYQDLVEIAQRWTPQLDKLSFEPGYYRFANMDSYVYIEEIKLTEEEKHGSKTPSSSHPPILQQKDLPTDLTIITGQGEDQQSIQVNQSLLCEMVPGFEDFKNANVNAEDSILHCNEITPSVFEDIITHFISRFDYLMEDSSDKSEAFHDALRSFQNTDPNKKWKLNDEVSLTNQTLTADTDDSTSNKPSACSSDALFIVGPDETEIRANRSVLAAMSPVLNRMLFGVDLITVDPTAPIVWPDFDAEMVDAVFIALRKRKGHISVPSERVASARTFLDFIGELDFIQVLRSDISFEEVKHICFQAKYISYS